RRFAGPPSAGSPVRPVRGGGTAAGAQVRPILRRAGAPLRVLAQPGLRLRRGTLRRRRGARALSAAERRRLGGTEPGGAAAHGGGARLARLAVREARRAPAH